jgi:hypothetical protein
MRTDYSDVTAIVGFTGGQIGRQAIHIPETEDTLDEREFLTANDPLQGHWIDIEDFSDSCFDDRPTGPRVCEHAKKLLAAKSDEAKYIEAAVKIAVVDPSALVAIYREGLRLTGIHGKHARTEARTRFYDLLMSTFVKVLEIKGVKELNRALLLRRVNGNASNPTLFDALAQFARNEMRNAGFGHYTATTMLAMLGHTDAHSSNLG